MNCMAKRKKEPKSFSFPPISPPMTKRSNTNKNKSRSSPSHSKKKSKNTSQHNSKENFLYDSNTCTVPREEVVKVTIAENVTEIDLYDCPRLESITLPSTLTHISKHAFESCTAIQTVEIPKSVCTIGESAFRYCFQLKSIDVPEGVTLIDKEVFNGCSDLVSVSLPQSLTEIRYYAFSPCVALPAIYIPNEVTKLGQGVFCDCKSMKRVQCTVWKKWEITYFTDVKNYNTFPYHHLSTKLENLPFMKIIVCVPSSYRKGSRPLKRGHLTSAHHYFQ